MKKQVVFIHGGESFNTYEGYLEDLRMREYDPYEERVKRWKDNLGEKLGEDYEVFQPAMPSGGNAKYVEWKIVLEKVFPYLGDGAIFVGHSLGGVFLAKYFAEEELPKKVGGVILISAPFWQSDVKDETADFVLPDSLEKFEKQVKKITIYHSEDDVIVPFAHAKKYQKKLPQAKLATFTDRGHFLQSEFSEIIENIKNS